MPEGDTVHTLAAALTPLLIDARIERAAGRLLPHNSELAGRCVKYIYAKGKHLFMELDDGGVLRTHLGLYGSWHQYRLGETWHKPAWQASLVLWTAERVLVCFNARDVEWLRDGGLRHRDTLHHLGPDLTNENFDLRTALLRAREMVADETPVLDVLLDQRLACGIGNIYKSEVLFIERIHPLTRFGQLGEETLGTLYQRARALLLRNVGVAARTTRFTTDGRGRLWVYGRVGKPCFRCQSTLQRAMLGKDLRVTYWCPQCQPQPSPANGFSRIGTSLVSR